MARRLTDGEQEIWNEMQRDAAPSVEESVAEWAGVPLDDVTQHMIEDFMNACRRDAAEGWGTP